MRRPIAMARILIAEDSPDIRALIQMLLEAEGHRVTAVEDGRAAPAAPGQPAVAADTGGHAYVCA